MKIWSNWVNAFKSLISRYVKTKMVKRKRSPPWFDGEILHTLHMKDNIRKKHKLNQLFCNKLKELRSRVKHMIANARKSFFTSLPTDLKLNPKRFWSLLKYSSKKSTFPQRMTMKIPNNDEMNDANDPNSVADLFKKYFASVFHNDSDLVTKDDIDTRNID